MKKTTLISVIIPTLNEEKVLTETLIQFNKAKGRYDFEVIVSDGGSKDKTVNIAKKWVDKVVTHTGETRQTIASGKNAGTKVAAGDLYVFLDSDIRIPDIDNFFEKVLQEFHKSIIVAATAKILIYPEEETFFDRLFHNFFTLLIATVNLLGMGGSQGECQIIRSNYFNKIGGFNEKLVASEDFDLFVRLNKIGKTCLITGLVLYESPRRIRKLGYPKWILTGILNMLSIVIRKSAFSREWEIVR